MREIKFRGQTTDTKEWVYGSLSQVNPNSLNGSYFICGQQTSWQGTIAIRIGNFFKVIPETVGQYTGLKDNNGAEIYEGDLIKHGNDDGVLFEVFYHDDRGQFLMNRTHYIGNRCGGYIPEITSIVNQVVGNIHEATEEQKKEWGLK